MNLTCECGGDDPYLDEIVLDTLIIKTDAAHSSVHLMNDATGSTYLCSPDRKIFDMFKLFPVCDQETR